MIQLALLLSGFHHMKANARYLLCLSLFWTATGAGIFIDGLDGQTYFPVNIFGALLLIESIVTLSVSSTGTGAQKNVLFFKGIVFLFCAVVILINHKYSNLLLSLIFGFAYILTGFFSLLSAWVIRFPGWRKSSVIGLMYITFSIILFALYHSAVSLFLGFTMTLSGISGLIVARRASRMSPTAGIYQMMQPAGLQGSLVTEMHDDCAPVGRFREALPLIIHVWTPEGTADAPTIPRPVINRYIAAVDETGVISAGHAAAEIPGELYISLYPEQDIDRSPSEFLRLLRASVDNDVPGRYLEDYATEASEWRDSDRRVVFAQYNKPALTLFWRNYRRTERYNLTYRNCSSSVAYALEAALEGVLADRPFRRTFLRVCLMPELWIAAHLRRRALNMAWTPGLVLDYARALRAVVHPVPEAWHQRLVKMLRKALLQKSQH